MITSDDIDFVDLSKNLDPGKYFLGPIHNGSFSVWECNQQLEEKEMNRIEGNLGERVLSIVDRRWVYLSPIDKMCYSSF